MNVIYSMRMLLLKKLPVKLFCSAFPFSRTNDDAAAAAAAHCTVADVLIR